MKKFCLLLIPIFLAGCTEDLMQPEAEVLVEQQPKAEGMQRVKVYSREQLRSLVESLDEKKVLSRSDYGESMFTENEELFVSLAEANKQKVFSKLTPAQLQEIQNDPDDLEFEPSDSIIADMRFAQLLNADREIQIGDTVYRYITKGLAYTTVEHAADLKKAELLTFNLDNKPLSRAPQGPIQISENMMFYPMDFSIQTCEEHDPGDPKDGGDEDDEEDQGDCPPETPGDDGVGVGRPNPGTGSGNTNVTESITLPNGTVIPAAEIHVVEYSRKEKLKGDGSWLHNTITGLFGKNILAVTNFSKARRRLAMNFYDQNYIVYAHIGTKLKMQKKVCGIWWNIKADELIQGWEVVTMKHVLKDIYKPYNPETKKIEFPSYVQDTNFPLNNKNEQRIFLHVPFVNYNLKSKQVNKALQEALAVAMKAGGKALADKDKKGAGVYTGYDDVYYFSRGPYSESYTNKRSVDVKYYKELKPFLFSFSYNFITGFSFKSIGFPDNKKVSLISGSVYGAIKYKGEWKAAKIIMYPDEI